MFAPDVNSNFWKYALPLLATAIAATVGIWLQPQPSAPDAPQTVASSAPTTPATKDCRARIDEPAGGPSARLDELAEVCREPGQLAAQ